MRLAALDFGSNTFLLLICEVVEGRIVKVLVDETEVVRLAQGMDQKKAFHPMALERAKTCLQRFAGIISNYQPESVLAVATSAARDASNKQDFLEITESFGIPLKIISGPEEASLTFRGSLFDQDPRGHFAVIDVGGGSTEIIGRNTQGEVRGWSVDVGSVRLTERLLSRHPLKEGELTTLRDLVATEFGKVREKIPEASSDLQVIAVAGTPVALAQIEQEIEFVEDRLHSYVLSLERISYWCERLSRMSIEERQKIVGMPSQRADVLVAGCAILEGGLKALGKTCLKVSTKGVRYGVALSMAEERSK